MKHELTLLLHRLFQKFTSSQVSEVDRTRELVNIETCERLKLFNKEQNAQVCDATRVQ
jgi:hypothetical protein